MSNLWNKIKNYVWHGPKNNPAKYGPFIIPATITHMPGVIYERMVKLPEWYDGTMSKVVYKDHKSSEVIEDYTSYLFNKSIGETYELKTFDMDYILYRYYGNEEEALDWVCKEYLYPEEIKECKDRAVELFKEWSRGN